MEELTEILNVNKVHIACLQETQLNRYLKLKIKGFTTLRKDRKDRPSGGLAFLVKSADIKFRGITLPPTTDYDENNTEKVIKTLNNQSTHQKADLLTNIISSTGTDAATNKVTASLLAKHYENKSKPTFNANDRKLLRSYRKNIQDSKRYNHKNIFTIPFSMEELEAAIAKMNPGDAPGPDVIFGRMVQHFLNHAKKELLEICNLSWATGKLPKIWKLFPRHSNSETKQECLRVQKL
ncbi:hypothetical protein TNCV_3052611 [Trichonephila clavipes]|nr:hypothetical protein TNCV_3052611 [Trichonephila clavipes]